MEFKKLQLSLLLAFVLGLSSCAQNWEAADKKTQSGSDAPEKEATQTPQKLTQVPEELTQRIEVYSEKASKVTAQDGTNVHFGQIKASHLKTFWEGKNLKITAQISVKDQEPQEIELFGVEGSDSKIILEPKDETFKNEIAAIYVCLQGQGSSCASFYVDFGIMYEGVLLTDQFKQVLIEVKEPTNPSPEELLPVDQVPEQTQQTSQPTQQPGEQPDNKTQASPEESDLDYGKRNIEDGQAGSLSGGYGDSEDKIATLLKALKAADSQANDKDKKPPEVKDKKPQSPVPTTTQPPPPPAPAKEPAKPAAPPTTQAPAPKAPDAPTAAPKTPVTPAPQERATEKPENLLRPTDQSVLFPFRNDIIKNGKIVKTEYGALDKATNFLKLAESKNFPFDIFLKEKKYYFGTFDLYTLVEKMANFAFKNNFKSKIGIATVARETGGPIYSYDNKGHITKELAHKSHMNGEDVDISYLVDDNSMRLKSMVSTKGVLHKSFMVKEQWELFKYIFSTQIVEVVFVDQGIKKALCKEAMRVGDIRGPTDNGEMSKILSLIRPEPYHDDHFHVRIKCLQKVNPRCGLRNLSEESSGCF